MTDSKQRYNELTNFNSKSLNISPRIIIPKLKETDYNRGYIVRYFAQKANDISNPISEISESEQNKLKASAMYATTNLRWRISGPKDPVYDTNGKIKDRGVRESNKISIKLASDMIPNLKFYLPNLTQFNR